MEHYKSGQYDDDLTAGMDDYNEGIDTGDVDLFDFIGEDDSPLSRLKSIILSIDWEITDDILRQFNEELRELKNLWSDTKVNLIYIQALEKISRYIYKEKSAAHPNAIKLLLAFYSNLEKVVSDDSLSDQETKKILLGDIERFERLKKQISPAAGAVPEPQPQVQPTATAPEVMDIAPEKDEPPSLEETGPAALSDEDDYDDPLLNLKAIVYGIDWEITEHDLKNLSSEVKVLENKFQTSKAKQIFLQGIGSLGAYISLKRSNAHADAFKLLHSFFIGLETVVRDNLTGQDEKDILLPQVEKFNAFKATIAETITPDAVEKPAEDYDLDDETDDGDLQPAFADVPEDVQGFTEDADTVELGDEDLDETVTVSDEEFDSEDAEADQALANEMESRLEGMFDEPDEKAAVALDAEIALQGVDVETEADDESDEEPLPFQDGELAPALALEDGDQDEEDSPAVFADQAEGIIEEPEPEDDVVLGGAIPGVDVEHEADDDSDEAPLPVEDGELAPALSDGPDAPDEETLGAEKEGIDQTIEDFFGEPGAVDADEALATEESSVAEEETTSPTDIDNKLDDFFGEDEAEAPPAADEEALAAEESSVVEEETTSPTDIDNKLDDFFGEDEAEAPPTDDEEALALQGVDVEHEADDDTDEMPLPEEDGELIPALGDEESAFDEPIAEMAADEPQPEASVEEMEDEEAAQKDVADAEAVVEEEFDKLFGDTFTDDTSLQEPQEIEGAIEQQEETEELAQEEELVFSPEKDALESEERVVERVGDEDEQATEELFSDDTSEDIAVKESDSPVEEDILEQQEETEGDDALSGALMDDAEPIGDASETVQDDEADEFAPALSDDMEEALAFVDDESERQDFSEDSVVEQFDSLFDTDDSPAAAEVEEPLTSEEEALANELLAIEDEGVSAEAVHFESFDDAGFEELPSDVDDFPEEVIAASIIEDDIDSDDAEVLALLAEDEKVAGSDDVLTPLPEDSESLFVEEEETEEEVIFEPVEDGDWIADASRDIQEYEETDDFDKSDSFGITILSDPEEYKVEDESETDEVEFVAVGEGDLFEEIDGQTETAYVAGAVAEPAEDILGDLRSCIVSLGLEIDDGILTSLNDEVEKLRLAMLDRPMENTFIQLLTSVSGHIDKYRYEADPEANQLLLSVFDKLEVCALGKAEAGVVQEALFTETSKVLQWQTRLIDRLAGSEGSGYEASGVEE